MLPPDIDRSAALSTAEALTVRAALSASVNAPVSALAPDAEMTAFD
jgi:hypothetical protein